MHRKRSAPERRLGRGARKARVSWEALNLAHVEERSSVEPTLGGVGLIYPGRRHILSGPQETAKTIAAYTIALAEVRAGGTALLIDLEMGQWDARERLRDLGATDDELDRLYYIEPDAPATEEIILGLVELTPTLVIIDAAAGAYGLQGLDDNKRADVERFVAIFIRPFWLAGIATLLVDHVVKNVEARGKYAIGSERKIGSADVHLGFEVVAPLSRGGSGLYKITTHKDRGGWLPRPKAAELELRSDPVTHSISHTFRAPRESESDGVFRPTILMERVSLYLEQQTEPVSRNAIEEAVEGKRDTLRMAINRLLADGFAAEEPGARGSRLVSSIRPYRKGDLAPTSPRHDDDDLAPTSPRTEPSNEAESTTSPQLAPTSPLAPESTSPQLATSYGEGRGGGARWETSTKRRLSASPRSLATFMPEPLLTARELAAYLGLKPGTILDKWERGELPGFEFGRAVRFDLDEVLASGRGPGTGGEAPATPRKRPANEVVSLAPATPIQGGEDA